MESGRTQSQAAKPPLTLHHLSSSQSLRVLWALEELADANGLSYTTKIYIRQKGSAPLELQAIFPLGLSPILVVDPLPDTVVQEQVVVTESRLILQYLADHYSNGIWTPQSSSDKHRNEYWQEFASATLALKVDFVMLFDILPPHMPWIVRPLVGAFCNAIANVYKKMLVRPFKLMEDALSEERSWFAGEKIGQADFLLSWPMDLALQRGISTQAYIRRSRSGRRESMDVQLINERWKKAAPIILSPLISDTDETLWYLASGVEVQRNMEER